MKRATAALLIATASILVGSILVNAGERSPSSADRIPDWRTWKCKKVHIYHELIETYQCGEPKTDLMSKILLKIKGSPKPFLIGWGYEERTANPTKNAYAALHKGGRWIVGARGTGFTTEEHKNSITFYVFLDDKFSAREKIKIMFPPGDEDAEAVVEVSSIFWS